MTASPHRDSDNTEPADWWQQPLLTGQSLTHRHAVHVSQYGQPNPVFTRAFAIGNDSFLILDMTLLLPAEALASYTHSKLYYSTTADGFCEDHTVWFSLAKTGNRQTQLLQIPDSVRKAGIGYFMVDGLPLLPDSSYLLHSVTTGATPELLHWLGEYDPAMTPQAVQLAGQLTLQASARPLVSLLARQLRTGSFAINYALTNAIIAALEAIGDPDTLALMANRLDVHHYHYRHGTLDPATGKGIIQGVQNGEDHAVVLGEFVANTYVVLDLVIDVDWANSRLYEYSKLYFDFSGQQQFTEDAVACFRLTRSGIRETLAVKLPPLPAGCQTVSLRLDPLPACQLGRFTVFSCRVLAGDVLDESLQRQADLDTLKQQTRRAVADSEDQQTASIQHLPESISLELTPRCDFTCGHCSSHGTKELHDEYNRMPIFPEPLLDKLAAEVFPSLSTLTIVGRGEPSIVPDKYWHKLMGHLRANRTRFTMVTHGYHIPRRLTEDNIDLIDTITISIDGITQDTFAHNRGGKDLARVLDNAAYYHALRKNSRLPKRPRLCFSWTLLKNNIHEFPDFVRHVARFEPDLLYVRHLLVYHSKDMALSLFDDPERANHYLREAYEVMAQHNIRGDCPPLFNAVDIELSKHRISQRTHGEFSPVSGTQAGEPIPVILGTFQKAGATHVRIDIAIDVDPADARQFQHSKLYFDRTNRRSFSEDNALCFRILKNGTQESVALQLPFELTADDKVCFRLDPLPACQGGSFTVLGFSLVRANELDADLLHGAQCTHHRTQKRQHWQEQLDRTGNASNWVVSLPFPIRAEAFAKAQPQLASAAGFNVIDHGNQEMAPDSGWQPFLDRMRQDQQLFRLSTQGYCLPHCITADTIDLIDGVMVCANLWPNTQPFNPHDSVIRKLLGNIAAYHDLRQRCGLARRPRLFFTWTITPGNAISFPDFVQAIAAFEPDAITIRDPDGLADMHHRVLNGTLHNDTLHNDSMRDAMVTGFRLLETHAIPSGTTPRLTGLISELTP